MGMRRSTGTSLIPIKLKQLGFDNYQQYLQTDHWKSIRSKYYRSKLPIRVENVIVCNVCKKQKRLNLHHKTYKRLGQEKLHDFILLCKDCHNLTHLVAKKIRNVGLWKAHKHIKKLKKLITI